MSTALHHTEGPVCALCNAKLKEANPAIAAWFGRVKAMHEHIHIAWSWRGQMDQDRFFLEKKTKAKFPQSAHNKMDSTGKPCARALDLFALTLEGEAAFPLELYAKVNSENVAAREAIVWAVNWKTFKESDHFEMA